MTPLLAQRPRADRAFERLYRKHVGDVYRYALAVLRSPDDAEDVTQTTFMNAYRAYQRGERPKAPRNWLIAIAHNVCRQRFRQSARRPSEVALDEELTEAQPEQEGPSAEEIRRALGHLAFNQRAALVMRELEGRSYAEIAEILDTSVSAVETLLFRGRRALREQLEEALTCGDAELAISRQLDGRLPRSEKGRLRAHLRECADCATFARSQRAQRSALKSLGAIPLPASLSSFFGGGGAAVGTGLAAKAVLIGATAAVAAGVGVEGTRHHMWPTLGIGQNTAADSARSQANAKLPPTASAVAAAAVSHTRVVVAGAKPAHAVPVRRSDLRPVKHVEHENNVRGARAEHKANPSHGRAHASAAPEPVAVAAARHARPKKQHTTAAKSQAATHSRASTAQAQQKPKQTAKHKPPAPSQAQQQQTTTQPPSSGSGQGSGQGGGKGAGGNKP
jgi:RNA polymerase sigma factor (sigma-70 family)